MRRLLSLLVLAALIAIGFWAEWSPRPLEAALALADLRAGAEPSLFKQLTPRPERQKLNVSLGGRRLSGDLYLPGDKAGAGLVLVPGAARDGKDDPRLVALAQTLARARFVVLVPDIANLRVQEIAATDRLSILDAARFLAGERRLPQVGVAAVSYGAVPALLAALEEPRIGFVAAIGAPHDLAALITFFTTGLHREAPDQPWIHATPNAYGKWAFVKANAKRLDDSGDRALLTAIADRRMTDESADIAELSASLGPQGKAVMALLDNTDPDKVVPLIKTLPAAIQAEIAAMDLGGRDLSGLRARLLLVHGRDDRIVPWTQSAALARRAPKAELTVLDSLAHADLRPSDLGDVTALWRTVTRLLEERDDVHRP